jgi:hypothetical protein
MHPTMRGLLVAAAVTTFAVPPAFARGHLALSLGGTSGHVFPGRALSGSDFMGSRWSDSRDVALGLEQPLAGRVVVAGRFEHSTLPFHPGAGTLATIPEYHFAGESGDASSANRWALDVRFLGAPRTVFRPVFSTGVVRVNEHPGSFRERYVVDPGGTLVEATSTFRARSYLAHEVELALRASGPLGPAVELGGGYLTNYGDRMQWRWRAGVVL